MGDVAEVGHALWAKACLANKSSRYAESLDLFEQCLACYRQLDDLYYISDALIWIGTCQRTVGAIEKSINTIQQSLDLRYAIDDIQGQHTGHSLRATLLLLSGEYELTEEEMSKSFALQAQMADTLANSLGNPWSGFRNETSLMNYHGWQGQMALLRGDLDTAWAHHQALLASGIDLDFIRVKSGPHLFLGLFAIFKGDYQNGQDKLVDIHARPRGFSWVDVPLAAWGLAMVHTALGEYEVAQGWLLALLQHGLSMRSNMLLTLALPVAALILAHNGDKQRAAELLGLAFNHPKSATGWMAQWPLLTRLRADLEAELGAAACDAAWERGAKLDLETTATDLLRILNGDGRTRQQEANANLDEPLTSRELEVLALLAKGYSNRQIAERLVIAVNTVKRYVYDVCQKLEADNRTHAVARARELGLL